MRKFSLLFIVLVLALGVNLTFAQSSKIQKKEKIVGTVIAQYRMNALMCVYHPCVLWLILRLEQDKKKPPAFAQLFVEYFPDSFPTKLIDKSKMWKFKVVKDANGDKAIEKNLNLTNYKNEKDAILAWELLPEAESEKIPFGEILPFYFVKSDDYKERTKK